MKVHSPVFRLDPRSRGAGSETVETPAPTLAALRDELIGRGGAYAEGLARGKAVRVALNQVMADEAMRHDRGCRGGFFPPVTGG